MMHLSRMHPRGWPGSWPCGCTAAHCPAPCPPRTCTKFQSTPCHTVFWNLCRAERSHGTHLAHGPRKRCRCRHLCSKGGGWLIPRVMSFHAKLTIGSTACLTPQLLHQGGSTWAQEGHTRTWRLHDARNMIFPSTLSIFTIFWD